jgi:hypothetical protein
LQTVEQVFDDLLSVTEFVPVAGHAAVVDLRGQVVVLPLEEFDHECQFFVGESGLPVHTIAPSRKKVMGSASPIRTEASCTLDGFRASFEAMPQIMICRGRNWAMTEWDRRLAGRQNGVHARTGETPVPLVFWC